MYLKSLSLRGFKSFPERTRLAFSPGVSVIVGPNGCGKSNITDAVLWALGEQSPLAVRGQSMQDVIFAGGKGSSPRRVAEVEAIIDNSEGRAASEFSEISIKRRVDRSGDSEYRLNGARCRLADIVEILSDTNMGREMHSVISQGRVEEIVGSKPRDRRLLIEEAAGLGKHRKRRHRAQLKLERTRDNLDRAVDIEREARSRLRPLKAQAEAADRHARFRRQEDEARAELVASDLRVAEDSLAAATKTLSAAQKRRDEIESKFADVARRRQQVEEKIAAGERRRREHGERLLDARSGLDRVRARADAIAIAERELRAGLGQRQLRIEELDIDGGVGEDFAARIAELEGELATLDGGTEPPGELGDEARAAEARRTELDEAIGPVESAAEEAIAAARDAAGNRDLARAEAEKAAQRRARLAGELSAVEARLAAAAGDEGDDLLAGMLQTAPGMELALSAALGERLRAAVVPSLEAGAHHLREAGGPARAILESGPTVAPASEPPTEDARPLLELVEADDRGRAVAERLLSGAWLVEDLSAVPEDFGGLAVTIDGHCFDGASGELRGVPKGATDPALAARSEREELVLRVRKREETEKRATRELELAEEGLAGARSREEAAATELRDARRALAEATEEANRTKWLAEQRRETEAAQRPEALRRTQIEVELAVERRHLKALERAREGRRRARDELVRRIASEEGALPIMETTREALGRVGEALEGLVDRLRSAAIEEAGDDVAAELRECSQQEYALQSELRDATETFSEAKVEDAQLRDRRDEAAAELEKLGAALERRLEVARKPLTEEERDEIETSLARLARRRDQLGPVNPLAEREYSEAREHVSDLKSQREDLERAMTELQALIRRTDREITDAFEETFEATAKNFEEMAALLFPGGRGRLRRVEDGPRPVSANGEGPEEDDAEPGSDRDIPGGEAEEMSHGGVEIEVTPAGKAMRRLSLLSGGEKSLVALSFIFAVLLARPCPFYILDEVEAALDDINLDRFLQLVRRFSDRSQFVIVTHQKRTMDAADVLYGISMGDDGITKVVSKRLPREEGDAAEVDEAVAEAEAA